MATAGRRVALAAGLLLTAAPLWAHHMLIAEFDVTQTVTLRGTLVELRWVNPHGWIHIDVPNPDGTVTRWAVETGSPYRMRKAGLNKTDFVPGAEVLIGGFKAKNGTPTAAGWIITFLDREASEEEGPASFALGR